VTRPTAAKIVLAVWGLSAWGYGVRVGNPWFQWTGVALLTAAVILRFLTPRAPPR
jgi:hypothetical protein